MSANGWGFQCQGPRAAVLSAVDAFEASEDLTAEVQAQCERICDALVAELAAMDPAPVTVRVEAAGSETGDVKFSIVTDR